MPSNQQGSTWEYLIIPDVDRGRLSELGRDGWELVAIGGNAPEALLYLKRPMRSFRERVTLDQRRAYFASLGLDDGVGEPAR
jgi:hypothetical protein